MADQWDTYITRAQNQEPQAPTGPENPFTSLLGRLFGSMGGQRQPAITPNKQGLYTPSMLPMPVGPPSPINHLAIKNLLNSGVLRGGQVPGNPVPPPEPAPAPASNGGGMGGLLSMLFGGR